MADPVGRMMESFDALTTYTALLESEGKDGRKRIYYAYQKPGFIRMDFVEPHKGARLIYVPDEKRVYLRPFSNRLIHLRLSPDNRLITDPEGHTVDQSDIGSLLRTVKKDADEGLVTSLPPELVEGLFCAGVVVETEGTVWILWVHPDLGLPVKVEKYLDNGEDEIVFLHNLAVDELLDNSIFIP
ncbi:hypothetical protein OOT00_06575 [Desulfobotulus sp. H1]|uniref:Outer membrane lipoprotein carrier protein LolA n=1 Tax=Desulfobotulus pelophilus TaxID=2823377 RepID=A0ABT3N9G7_9BACT|nr:hypothetical protein [Desulfobotulus pelophilus]MCW7753647.1 hypothetical protein [Desulfobotulus pelophilus]